MADNEYKEDDFEAEDDEIDLNDIDQLAEKVAERLMQDFQAKVPGYDEFV